MLKNLLINSLARVLVIVYSYVFGLFADAIYYVRK